MTDLDQIRHPRARKLFVMWNDWRGARAMPMRSELDLVGLKPVLPYMLILERSPVRPSYVFRLAGTGLRHVMGMELTGRDLLDLWSPGVERMFMERALDKVVGAHTATAFSLRGEARGGRHLAMEMLCLPVQVDNRRTVHVLGALLPFSEPFWLGDPAILRYRLVSRTTLSAGASEDVEGAAPSLDTTSPPAPAVALRTARSGAPPGRVG